MKMDFLARERLRRGRPGSRDPVLRPLRGLSDRYGRLPFILAARAFALSFYPLYSAGCDAAAETGDHVQIVLACWCS